MMQHSKKSDDDVARIPFDPRHQCGICREMVVNEQKLMRIEAYSSCPACNGQRTAPGREISVCPTCLRRQKPSAVFESKGQLILLSVISEEHEDKKRDEVIKLT